MSQSKAYLTYAINKDGGLIHIDSVPNGNECGCICPYCKSELCAKNGGDRTKMVHHFAHLSGADCVGAVESALHRMAKDILKEALVVRLPDRHNGECVRQLKFDRVEVEFYDKDTHLCPDCIGYYGDKVLWIEFKRTHAVDTRKRGKIISAKIDCIEIDLNNCVLDPEKVRRFITEDPNGRTWIRYTQPKSSSRQAGYSDEGDYYCDRYDEEKEYMPVQRIFALNEKNNLVDLSKDEADMNIHSYYCLACGKELSIDVDKYGNYHFVHIDDNIQCEDDLYLHEAAKRIVQYKFESSNEFVISVPQLLNCKENGNCQFYNPKYCSIEQGVSYDLKQNGYTECLYDCEFPEFNYKCDLVIKQKDSFRNAIIISINAGNYHLDVSTSTYRVLVIDVSSESTLKTLQEKPLGYSPSSFFNFKYNNAKTVPCTGIGMNRGIWKFSLFSSGKYHVDLLPCSKIKERKHSTVMELLFEDITLNKDFVKRYSLLKCFKEKRKVCLCEICFFLAEIFPLYEPPRTICKRYKTKGTPQYPLNEMKTGCPYFSLDRNLENASHNFNNVKVTEI